jgi:hypothetical protein
MATVVLFSSNIRPQYEKDIADVVAAARGSIMRFRYEKPYVAPELQADWSSNNLVQREAVVVYSIQQPANYHPPAFLPVRRATILRTEVEGSIYVVEFAVHDYVTLNPSDDPDEAGDVVRAFSAALKGVLSGSPAADDKRSRFSAATGEEPEGLVGGATEAIAFERLVGFLDRTVSFAGYAFWRLSRIRRVGQETEESADANGRFRLVSESTYEFKFDHFRRSFPAAPVATPVTFEITTDNALVEIVGSSSFTIASRYDSVPIRVRVPPMPEPKETILSVRPASGVNGPSTDVRLLVGPTPQARAATAAVTGGAAGLLVWAGVVDWTPAKVVLSLAPILLFTWLGFRSVPSRTR